MLEETILHATARSNKHIGYVGLATILLHSRAPVKGSKHAWPITNKL